MNPLLKRTLIRIAIGAGAAALVFILTVRVELYATYGYAHQTAVDPSVYRLEDQKGELVTFVLTKEVRQMLKFGTLPRNKQLTLTGRVRLISRLDDIVFGQAEFFMPLPLYQ